MTTEATSETAAEPGCIFCRIVAGEVPCFKLLEDDRTLAFMDINPANAGHALVIPKAHHRDLYTVPAALAAATLETAQRVARAIRAALAPEGLNLLQCNGPAAAQSVDHFHLHVLPRRDGDDLKMNWGLVAGDMDAIQLAAEMIRNELGAG